MVDLALKQAFIAWNSQRLNISLTESFARYQKSWNLFPNGHGGVEYRNFCGLVHDTFSVFHSDAETEVLESYRIHAELHLLRMLSYRVPDWKMNDPVIEHLKSKQDCTVVDYGCGLGHSSISLCIFLGEIGINCNIVLVDVPSIKLEFLRWYVRQLKINSSILECTLDAPIPSLPKSDFVIATEVFEHIHDPMPQLLAIDQSLRSQGMLYTNLGLHEQEFFHVCPDLSFLKQDLLGKNYAEIRRNILFQKP